MGRFLGYARVSRVGDRDATLISPQLQEEHILTWAKSNGHEVEMLPAELDQSGANDDRPILNRAIVRVEAGEVDGIVVWKFDRFTRSLYSSLKFLERIEAVGGVLRSTSEQLDATTPAGRMTRNILMSVAQGEREHRAAEFERIKASAIERGIYISSKPPVGYRRGPDRRLEIDLETAPVIRAAFRKAAAGDTLLSITRYLAEALDGWAHTSTRKLFRNPVYLGIAKHGKHVNPEAHEPLVSRAEWEAAQIDRPRPARRNDGGGLLSGLLWCAGCSSRMSSSVQGGIRYYRCRRHHAAGRCPAPAYISSRTIEPYIAELAMRHIETVEARADERNDAVTEAETALQAAEAELTAFQEAVSVSQVGVTVFADGLKQRADTVDRARRALAAAKLAAPILPAGTDLRGEWEGMDVAERRHVLRGALGAVWVAKGRGLGRVRAVAPGFEPQRPVTGGPRQVLATVDLGVADLPGELRMPGTHDLGEGDGSTADH